MRRGFTIVVGTSFRGLNLICLSLGYPPVLAYEFGMDQVYEVLSTRGSSLVVTIPT